MNITDLCKDVIVVILGGGRGSRLEPLTRLRAKPAVPLAGKYRLIDVTISNAIHSGMERMFVLTQYNSVSLHRHIVRTYKFDYFSKGFVQILAAQQTKGSEAWFQGTADAVRRNLDIISASRGEYVLILSGDHLYRMDYRPMLRDHVELGADMTLSVLPVSREEIWRFGAVRVDSQGGVAEFREKPGTPEAQAGMEADPELLARRGGSPQRPFLASMGIYLFNKECLLDALNNELSDFGHHVIPGMLDRRKLAAHFFNGYWRDIGSVSSFYEAHMDMVSNDPQFRWDDDDWMFYTHPRYLPGSRLDDCRFERSILAGGAQIVRSEIESSIVGIRASIDQAQLRRSYLMGAEDVPAQIPGAPPVGVGKGSVVEGAIVDLNARIGRDVRLVNANNVQEAAGDGWVIQDGIIVVPKNAVIPDGTVV